LLEGNLWADLQGLSMQIVQERNAEHAIGERELVEEDDWLGNDTQ
jgi:hypothetical protein